MKFNIKTFYLIAGICFGLVFIFNLWNFVLIFKQMNFPSKASFIIGSLFFNLFLSIFFFWFYKSSPDEVKDDKKLDNWLNDVLEEQKQQKEVEQYGLAR